MKKIILIIGMVFTLLLVGGVIAQSLLPRQDSQIDIIPEYEQAILQKSGANSISVEVSNIICDNTYCFAKVYQRGVINTEFRTDRYFCIEYDDSDDEIICIYWEEKTNKELYDARDSFVEYKLNVFGNATIQRNERDASSEEKVGAGTITVTTK